MKDKKWRYIVSDNIDRIIDTVSSYNPEDEMIDKIDGVIQLDENIDIHDLLEDMPPKYKTIIWDYLLTSMPRQSKTFQKKKMMIYPR
jgi:hypothetical protein